MQVYIQIRLIGNQNIPTDNPLPPSEGVVVPSLSLLLSFIYFSISTAYFYQEADISIV